MTNVVNSIPVTETGKQFQVNKWVRLGLSLLIVIFGAIITFALQYDWTTVVDPKTASVIVLGIGVIKSIYDSFAPSAGSNVIPTGSSTSLITHKSLK